MKDRPDIADNTYVLKCSGEQRINSRFLGTQTHKHTFLINISLNVHVPHSNQ